MAPSFPQSRPYMRTNSRSSHDKNKNGSSSSSNNNIADDDDEYTDDVDYRAASSLVILDDDSNQKRTKGRPDKYKNIKSWPFYSFYYYQWMIVIILCVGIVFSGINIILEGSLWHSSFLQFTTTSSHWFRGDEDVEEFKLLRGVGIGEKDSTLYTPVRDSFSESHDEDCFIASTTREGGGYGYLPWVDMEEETDWTMSLWVKLLPTSHPHDDNDVPRVLWETETLMGNAVGNDVIPSQYWRKAAARTGIPLQKFVGGCQPQDLYEAHHGMTLQILTGQRLALTYPIFQGGNKWGCTTLTSVNSLSHHTLGEWMHVGVRMTGLVTDDTAKGEHITLNVNGIVVAERMEQNRYRKSMVTTPPTTSKQTQRTRIGQNAKGTFGLEGRIALLAFWNHKTPLKDLELPTTYSVALQLWNQKKSQRPYRVYRFDEETRIGLIPHSVSILLKDPRSKDMGPRATSAGRLIRRVPIPGMKDIPRGGGRYAEHVFGTAPQQQLSDEEQLERNTLARMRRSHVRNSMQHAWEGYRTYAWGRDEVLPRSRSSHDVWGGMGTTLVDSLSTLWLMNMTDDFWEARDWVRDELTFHTVDRPVSVFETIIRSLGGLLSAYDLSGDSVFLQKATDLGTRLLPAFDSESGIPYGQTTLHNGEPQSLNVNWHSDSAALAEVGTMQVEFRYLSHATGNRNFAKKAVKIIDLLEEAAQEHLQVGDHATFHGLFPLFIRNQKTKISFRASKLSLGAMGDSFYEYLLKVWLQGGKTEPKYRRMYDRAMDGMHELLVQQSKYSQVTFLADMGSDGKLDHKMDHLACFMGGNLALGAYTHPDGIESESAQRDLRVGKALAYTCYQMYARTKTGIAPEFVRFMGNNNKDMVKAPNAPFYLLRPETVETMFVLFQLTGDEVYREWGWEIFTSIEQYCRTDIAYASIDDVGSNQPRQDDRMESFFLAETLKYLYLLMDPETEVDILEKHVFNTEAHPLRMLHKVV